jgi:SpoVK/Ycf46/Vps4 family AAA+-type ATPase
VVSKTAWDIPVLAFLIHQQLFTHKSYFNMFQEEATFEAPVAPTDELSALREQVDKYEQMLEQFLGEKKEVHTIVAGPFVHNNAQYYRVNGTVMFLNEEPIFGDPITQILEPGTEVICIGSAIIAVVPKELEKVTDIPHFNLIDWNEIGGLKSQLSNIREAIELPLKHQELAKEMGLGDFPGLVLYGPPGCGKTLIGKAIASTILGSTKVDPAAFVYVKGAEMLSKFVGEAEQKVAHMFHATRQYCKKTGQRAVVFMDEAEALLRQRGSGKSSDVEMTIVPTFLSEMDGLEKEHNPIFILATNLPNALDEAIVREGRIDLKIGINRPDHPDTKEIFEIHLKKVKCHDKVEDLAIKGADMLFSLPCKSKVSGAMVEAIAKGAVRKALTRMTTTKKTPKGVTAADLEESIKLINSSYAKA